jgi:phosphate starvation-inducible protein PhoH
MDSYEYKLELGEPKPEKEKKQRQRKTKKPSEKELLNEYYLDSERDREKERERGDRDRDASGCHSLRRKLYENIEYLSHNERSKFDNKFTKPKNYNQEEYTKALKQKHKKIVIAAGPSGTGKTLFATEMGVKSFLTGTCEKIIFTRPSVSVDEDLGYLPGTLEEKMAPWVRPIYDILYNFILPKDVQTLMEDKIIEIAPLGYMRGRTFKNCWIIADEMQNSTVAQMKMLLTRLGENSRLIITGDLEQYDKTNEINGLEDFMFKFKGRQSNSIHIFEFEKSDIQREEVVREVLDIYGTSPSSEYMIMKSIVFDKEQL